MMIKKKETRKKIKKTLFAIRRIIHNIRIVMKELVGITKLDGVLQMALEDFIPMLIVVAEGMDIDVKDIICSADEPVEFKINLKEIEERILALTNDA